MGAGLGLAFLHLPNPYLQLLGMALVVGVASALTHVFRGALSYLPMLAGITIGVVVLPSVLTPDASLDLALSRVECTLIGVLVTTLLCSRTTPRSQRKHYYERVRVLAADALGLAAQALGPSYDQPDASFISSNSTGNRRFGLAGPPSGRGFLGRLSPLALCRCVFVCSDRTSGRQRSDCAPKRKGAGCLQQTMSEQCWNKPSACKTASP